MQLLVITDFVKNSIHNESLMTEFTNFFAL